MRVLFITNPGEGQFYPMVPSAWALRAAGHDVLVAAPAEFLPKIRSAGLPATASCEPLDAVAIMTTASGGSLRPIDMPWEDQVRAAARGHRMLTERTLPGLLALIGTWRPDLVIGESVAFCTPLAADRHGVPWVEHRHGLAMPAILGKFVAEELNRELPAPVLIVDNCPPSLQHEDAPPGHVIRYVPHGGPGDVTDWMLECRRPGGSSPREPAAETHGRKRVCVTLGTGVPHHPDTWSLFELLVATLDELALETILAIPNPGKILPTQRERLPASVRAVGWFPPSAMMPVCDLVICHGGAGTVTTALVSGVPVLVLPHYGDQPINARRVTELGAALTVPLGQISSDSVKAAVSDLLHNPGYRQVAQNIAAENARQPTPADLVEVLREQAGRKASRS